MKSYALVKHQYSQAISILMRYQAQILKGLDTDFPGKYWCSDLKGTGNYYSIEVTE